MARRIFMDSDGGVDDALALAWALRAPEADLAGLSACFGNVAMAQAARNLDYIRRLAGADGPAIALGAQAPGGEPARAPAPRAHGADGLGGARMAAPAWADAAPLVTEPKAAEALADFAHAEKSGAIIVIGPATNLATALARAPDAFAGGPEVVLMVGDFDAPGPSSIETSAVDFNARSDPAALASALGALSAAGQTPCLVGLDLTRQMALTPADLADLSRPNDPLTTALAAALSHYMRPARPGAPPRCHPHDALALGAAIAPEAFDFADERVRVAGDGRLSRDPKGWPARRAARVDAPAMRARIFEALAAGSGGFG